MGSPGKIAPTFGDSPVGRTATSSSSRLIRRGAGRVQFSALTIFGNNVTWLYYIKDRRSASAGKQDYDVGSYLKISISILAACLKNRVCTLKIIDFDTK